MAKHKRARRPLRVPRLADLAERSGEFDRLFYRGSSGCQPGVWIEVRKGGLEAYFRVGAEPIDKNFGYNPFGPEKSRITYLSIRETDTPVLYGKWDPRELTNRPRHTFLEDPPEVVDLAKLVVKYFGR